MKSLTISEKLHGKIFPLSRQHRQWMIVMTLIIGDFLALSLAFRLAYYMRFELLPYQSVYDINEYTRLVLSMLPFWILIFAVFQLYSVPNLFGGLQEYSRVFNGVSAGVIALMILSFLRRDDLIISRGWLAISWIFALIAVILTRFIIRRTVFALRSRGHLLAPALIIGANAEGQALAEQLRDWPTSGLYITGFVDDEQPAGAPVSNGYRILGQLNQLEELVDSNKIEEIIISPTALNREQLLDIFQCFTARSDVNLRLSSGLFEILTTGLRVRELAYVPLIEINKSRISGFDAFLKWVMDYSLTIVGMIFALPVMLIVSLAVKLDTPGPSIYRRRVMGTNGQEFDAFKFRTMYINGEEILAQHPELQIQLGEEHKLKNDPRITRVGKIIRKFSLDELPQVFNVIMGQMSLIGPRMISPPEMAKYGKWGMNLLTVKPGITGLWQISGRSDVSYEDRVRIDMHYIRNWTIWLDIFILLATLPAVIRKKGAY